jgi:histidyl-tRNA synthetase
LSKEAKHNRLKARLPRGLSDRGPAEIAATRRMIETIRAVYERYGFEPVETPAIEYTDALGKFLPDQDRPNEGVFSFQDDDAQWLSLRYDLTAPLARYVAENFDQLPKPYRSYRFGWVFRNEKPGPGRFRQFMQFDADTVGSSSPAADAEMCMMAADTMEALGIPRGSYVVKVNNRKILDGAMDAIGIGGEQHVGTRLTVLRAMDKLDRLGVDGVRQLLGSGRKDESGDFTEGAGLNGHQIETLEKLYAHQARRSQDFFLRRTMIDAATRDDVTLVGEGGHDYVVADPRFLDTYAKIFANSALALAGIDELRTISDIVRSAGYGTRRIKMDVSVVRGLEYYTGPVFEVDLTFPTDSAAGSPRFGSVGGGGRYDGLVGRFRNDQVPATGFSIGVSRLMAALIHLGKIETKAEAGPVVVTVFDKDRLADYQRMVQRLREAGIRAELYLGSGKMGPQLKYADKRGAPCVVIQGGDEKAKGEVQIKDLIAGAKAAAAIASNQEWRETRPAQFAAKEEDVVDKVREVLARHGVYGLAPEASPMTSHEEETRETSAACEVTIAIDDSHVGAVCDFGVGFLKLKYRKGDLPVIGTGTFARLGKISGIITAGHVIESLPRDKVGLARFPRVNPAHQRFELDMAKTDAIVTWSEKDGDAPDIGFIRISELDAKDLEAKGAVFYNLEVSRKFVASDPNNRVAKAHAIVGVVAEWTEEMPARQPTEREVTVGGLFGTVKNIRDFKENDTNLVEVEIDYAAGPIIPKSYAGISGGALWQLHIEIDHAGQIVRIGKELRGVPFRQSADHRVITSNDLPSVEGLKKEIANRWPVESIGQA